MRNKDDLLSGLSQSSAAVNSKRSWSIFSGMTPKREMGDLTLNFCQLLGQ